MEVELQGTILPQFRVEIPPIIKQSNTHFSSLRVPSAFGESFSITCSRWKSLEVHCNNGQSMQQSAVSSGDNIRLPDLSFNRLQPSDQECDGLLRRHFGRYLAREAVLDEEYWTAAWLRAEAHWESTSYMRHIDMHKRKYAEQEFYALKRRCSGLDGNSLKCFCLVSVKREDKNIRRTVLNSVVGTLDLSIRQFLQGETFPGVFSFRRQRGHQLSWPVRIPLVHISMPILLMFVFQSLLGAKELLQICSIWPLMLRSLLV